jgi:hypothetical protein
MWSTEVFFNREDDGGCGVVDAGVGVNSGSGQSFGRDFGVAAGQIQKGEGLVEG